MNPKVSIIVPVYNLGNHISKGVESLLGQTFTNFEILLINDGSTDNSRDICDQFAQQDARVKVFHKENGGVSSARNMGIKNAKGTYTIHMDGDDFIEPSTLEDMYLATEKEQIDIVISDFFVDYGSKTKISRQRGSEIPSDAITNILNGELHGSVCNKLVRTSIYKDSNLRFREDVIMCEDLLFNIETLLLSSNIRYTKKAHLHYVQRDDSCVHTWSDRLFDSYCRVANRLDEILSQQQLRALSNFKISIKRDLLHHGSFNSKEFKKTFTEVNKYILVHPTLSLKSRVFLFLASVGPYNMLKKISRSPNTTI